MSDDAASRAYSLGAMRVNRNDMLLDEQVVMMSRGQVIWAGLWAKVPDDIVKRSDELAVSPRVFENVVKEINRRMSEHGDVKGSA